MTGPVGAGSGQERLKKVHNQSQSHVALLTYLIAPNISFRLICLFPFSFLGMVTCQEMPEFQAKRRDKSPQEAARSKRENFSPATRGYSQWRSPEK